MQILCRSSVFFRSNWCVSLLQSNTGMEATDWTAKLPQKCLCCSMLRATIILANESHVFWELSLCSIVANNSFFYSNKFVPMLEGRGNNQMCFWIWIVPLINLHIEFRICRTNRVYVVCVPVSEACLGFPERHHHTVNYPAKNGI